MSRVFGAIFIGLFIFLYCMLNYYIGRRGWQALSCLKPLLNSKAYWVVFWVLALSYLAGRLGQGFLLQGIDYWLTLAGAYWLAAMVYFALILAFIDLVRLLDKWLGFIPAQVKQHPLIIPVAGLTVLTLVLGIMVYGAWNARHPIINRYNLTIAKKAGSLRQLHVVMVSDVHLGEIIHNGRLINMVKMINEQNPDLILLPGDIIDENIGPFVDQNMSKTLRQLKSKYGVYAVPGNHDNNAEAFRYLQESGIRVLMDSYVKIADSIWLVGRNDPGHRGEPRSGQPVRKLADVLQGVDKSLPIIEMNHQPTQFEEARENGVDLQLSGHTHRGQLFPFGLITARMYEIDWGLLRKGSFQVIVSSGYGTWGPPVRVGNFPEIVDITVKFAE